MFCSRNCYFEFRYAKPVRIPGAVSLSMDANGEIEPFYADNIAYYGEILSFENQKQMLIPRGFAHGYLTLADDTLMQWCVDNDFCGEAARAVRYDSDFIWQNEPWPVREYILSEKDKNAIKLSDLRKF